MSSLPPQTPYSWDVSSALFQASASILLEGVCAKGVMCAETFFRVLLLRDDFPIGGSGLVFEMAFRMGCIGMGERALRIL